MREWGKGRTSNHGMRLKDNFAHLGCPDSLQREIKLQHGISRSDESNGIVIEASYKRGRKHGLFRATWFDICRVQLFKNDNVKAELYFKIEGSILQETYRHDSLGLLKKMNPSDFGISN